MTNFPIKNFAEEVAARVVKTLRWEAVEPVRSAVEKIVASAVERFYATDRADLLFSALGLKPLAFSERRLRLAITRALPGLQQRDRLALAIKTQATLVAIEYVVKTGRKIK
ncbi:MAG: hypothetical protein IJE97_07665 [Thermoguttaceae bacterium]|nr:hypothetical protein [Thermoguttaceae bacterium]MBQ7110682.1 hypothetical protein [Thermoguttaceae bacterium]